ncbi:MAG TPA: hypothetical protein VH914_15410 [Acidimicrobiia bacterium]|nr:hypothetical protein [Acidimicrobiia bacterium]
MTVVESAAYDDIDVVEAEVIDVDDGAGLDARQVVEAIVVDALALDPDVVEAELVDAETVERPQLEPEAKPQRHLRVAPDLVGRRRRVRIAAAGAAVAISTTLFAVVGFNVELAQHQIQLQKLQDHLQTEQHRYYDLRKQVAERSAPQNIVGEAERAGLVATSSSDLTVPIPQPPRDKSGETGLSQIHDNADGSLANLQP